jgi:protein-disulfide isomerase
MSTKTSSRARRLTRAKALRREQRRRQRRRTVFTTVAVVAVLAVVVTVGFLVTRNRDTTDDVAAPAAGSGAYGVALGATDALHTVVVYEDFLCPYCRELETATREALGGLAEDGRVRVEYRPFELLGSLGDYSRRATSVFAVVLDRSGSAAALRFHDALYEHQPSESGPFLDDAHLVEMAVAAGADRREVLDGLADGAGDAWVEEANDAASGAGVRSTPTILLDGEVFTDGRTMQELADNLVSELR